jgi:hypothetical protein
LILSYRAAEKVANATVGRKAFQRFVANFQNLKEEDPETTLETSSGHGSG